MLTQPTNYEAAMLQIVATQIQDQLLDLEPDREILPTDTFGDLGLNSLMLAQVLIALETELGVDPFSGDRSVADLRTVGDLVAAYSEASRAEGAG